MRIRYLQDITLAGSLCMVFIGCVSSPVATEFFRAAGATELHFGLLGGLPMIMLLMQFVGAWWTNRMTHRRRWFVPLVIAARLLYLGVVLLPLVPGVSPAAALAGMIGLIALSGAIGNLTGPMWFSWMGDLIPHRILNRYWGGRQRATTLTLTLTSLLITTFTFHVRDFPVMPLYVALVCIGCTAGTIDILLFLRVREPPNVRSDEPFWQTLLAPLRERNYRSLVTFLCAQSGAGMLAAVFMLVYTLEVLRVPLWATALLWCLPGLGAAIVAPAWGRLADRYGHRPILRVCVAFKPGIVIAFLLVTPETAFWVLVPALFFDSMLNAGLELASNGYMLKLAPRRNRSMFIAAMSSLSGLCGGLGAIAGGMILSATADTPLSLFSREWNHYQLLFFLSLLLRLPCIPLAGRIREPSSARSRVVLSAILDIWPFRFFSFPVGLYRRTRFPDEP